MTDRITPIPQIRPARRTLSDAQVRQMAAQALETVEQLRQEREVNAKVDRVIAATEAVIREATDMPLHERSETDRRRIESDLWVLAESFSKRERRSPFWRDLGTKAA